MHGQRQRPQAKVEVDASHRYGDLVVHEQLKFTVAANEFVCICGPSGCGKTTLLDMLAGILQALAGHGADRRQAGRSQAAKHLLRVPGAVHVPLADRARQRRHGAEDQGRARAPRSTPKVRDIVEMVGLTGFEGYYPASDLGRHEAAGRDRPCLRHRRRSHPDGRAVRQPRPAHARAHAARGARHLAPPASARSIFVTHNLEEAVFLGDRILILSAKPARIVAELPVRTAARPRDPLSAEFMSCARNACSWLHAPNSRRSGPKR